EPAVFNASDLSNGILISEKKSKKEKEKQEVKQETNPVTKEETGIVQEQRTMTQQPKVGRISVYPNPVTNGIFRISFEDQQPGRYQVHFMDVAGKVISTSNTTITGRSQVAEFRIPELITGGNYLVQVVNLQTQEVITNKVVVQ
ncbi:MAG TPA: T9SS type A sorting domain-containing protein, partial [Flavisolibacter sp.]